MPLHVHLCFLATKIRTKKQEKLCYVMRFSDALSSRIRFFVFANVRQGLDFMLPWLLIPLCIDPEKDFQKLIVNQKID